MLSPPSAHTSSFSASKSLRERHPFQLRAIVVQGLDGRVFFELSESPLQFLLRGFGTTARAVFQNFFGVNISFGVVKGFVEKRLNMEIHGIVMWIDERGFDDAL